MMEDDDKIRDLTVYQMEQFLARKRPPEEIRDQLDMGYKKEGQEIIIFDIRPYYKDPSVKLELPFARTKYVKARNIWKVYWKRASGKWELYEPMPEVNSLSTFLALVEEDEYGCFFG